MPFIYTVKIINNIEQAMLLEKKWRALTEGDPTNVNSQHNNALQCFMSWEWLSQWLRTYQDYIAELKIISVLYNDETIAIAPFYISTSKIFGINKNTLSFIATNEPEYCEVASEFIDIAYSTKHKQKITELLTAQLTKLTSITQYSFKDLHKNSLMYLICQKLKPQMLAYKEQTSGYQFVTNTNNHPQYSASFLKKKKRIINKYNKICDTKNCQFIIANNKTDALKLYEQLVKLHQKRWQQKNKPGVFSNTYFYQFHKNLIEQSFDKKMIILSAIKIGNQMISVNYSITWQNILYFYQSGIDEIFKPNISPGLLNHLLLINYCEKKNIKQYNLLKSSKADDYKSKFSQLGDELSNITMLSFNKVNYLTCSIQFIKNRLKRIMKQVKYE
jgi:hypothetical protein